jgi:hypothetical protein
MAAGPEASAPAKETAEAVEGVAEAAEAEAERGGGGRGGKAAHRAKYPSALAAHLSRPFGLRADCASVAATTPSEQMHLAACSLADSTGFSASARS